LINDVRNIFLLKENLVFLNHGSFGACPKPVFASYQNWQVELERQPVEFLDQERSLLKRLVQVRIALAEKLGASPDDLVGVTNATEGLNIVAHSLDLSPGDEILTTDHEYGALERTWKLAASRTGAKIIEAEIPLPLTSETEFFDTIVDAMTDRTKVLFLSHITSPTALLFPIKKVVAEARARGIITIIDGAHVPALIDLNLDELDADFYCGNCHKWMMAPKGSAFLWARTDMQPILDPLVVSHGWVPKSGEIDQKGALGHNRFLDCLEVQGTRDPAAWLATIDAIEFINDPDWLELQRQSDVLAQDTAQLITDLTGLPRLSSPEFCAPQMIALQLPDCDVSQLKRQLYEDHNIEIPVFRWQDRCIVRLSVQAYNSKADTSQLVQALAKVLIFSEGT
jgi:isopenicillin-N epimerase